MPQALIDYWTGRAKKSDSENMPKTMNQIYTKMDKEPAFRQEVAERIGIGFELPKRKLFPVFQEMWAELKVGIPRKV